MDLRLDEVRRRRAAGEHLAAMRLAQEILKDPGELTDRECFEAARFAAGSAMAIRQHFQAREFTREERTYAEVTGDPDLIAIASFHYGTAEMWVGDDREALDAFDRFLHLDNLASPALVPYRGAARFNRGVTLMRGRRYAEAVRSFQAARSEYVETGDLHGSVRCDLESAWATLLMNAPAEAEQYLSQATATLEFQPDEQLQAILLCHQAFWHLRRGETTPALNLCEELLTEGRRGVTDYQRSEAAWIAGECALTMGLLREANGFAALALDYSIKAQWPSLMNQANDLRRRVMEALQRSA